MAKYVYPAIFTKEDSGYSILFPDLESCYTSAETLEEGMELAQDVLCLTLYGLEEESRSVPPASAVNDVPHGPEEFVSLVACNTLAYRRFYNNKAVKKTLTLPSWLNDMAERAGINFSGTLQEALKAKLHLSES